MIDHVILAVSDVERSVDFYTATLAPLGVTTHVDYDDPRYYAANVFDPDGHSLEFVYKSWQH